MGRQGIRDVQGFPGWDDKSIRVLSGKGACLLDIKLPRNISVETILGSPDIAVMELNKFFYSLQYRYS